MEYKVITFPSVYETAFGNTQNAAKDLLNGLKIKNGELGDGYGEWDI
jgi:hypothetical protein